MVISFFYKKERQLKRFSNGRARENTDISHIHKFELPPEVPELHKWNIIRYFKI